jgi:hypothetical protein
MGITVNGGYYPSIKIVKNGESVTGSFYKMQVMASGSVPGGSVQAPGHLRALKDVSGTDIVSASMGTGGLFVPPGTTIEMFVTSASLDATSAPIMFWS